MKAFGWPNLSCTSDQTTVPKYAMASRPTPKPDRNAGEHGTASQPLPQLLPNISFVITVFTFVTEGSLWNTLSSAKL